MYHYLDVQKQPQGPFTLGQLRQMETSGVITPETLVAAAGDSRWRPWREISSSAATGAAQSPEGQVAAANGSASAAISSFNERLERFVFGLYGKWPAPGVMVRPAFDSLLVYWNYVLQMGILLAGAIAAILLVVAAAKFDSTYPLLLAAAAVPTFYIFQYVVSLFASANIKLLNGPTISLFSMVLQRAFVVVGTVAAVTWALIGAVLTIMAFAKSLSGGLNMLGMWLAILFVGLFACWVAARCEDVLNVRPVPTKEQNAADYFANLVRLLGRFLLSLTPLIGALATLSLIVLLFGIGTQLFGENGRGMMFTVVGGAILATGGTTLALVFLLPIAAHFIYISIVTLSEIVTAFFRLVHDNSRMASHANKDSETSERV